MKVRRAVFIEFPEQIPVFKMALDGLDGAQVVALSPHAALELERADIPHRILADFFDEKKIEELGWETAGRTNELVALIDDCVQEFHEPFRSAGFRPAHISAYNLKKLYDSVALRLYELRHFLDGEKPDEIAYAAPAPVEFGETLRWEERSLYSIVLRVTARESGVAAREIPFDFGSITSTVAATYFGAERTAEPRTVPRPAWWAPRMAGRIRRAATRRLRAGAARARRAAGSALGGMRAGRLPVVLDLQRTLPPDGWGGKAVVWFWDRAEARPVSADGVPVALPRAREPEREDHMRAALAAAFDAIRRQPKYAALFNYEGWDWSDAVTPRLEHLCTHVAPRLWQKRLEAREILRTLRADVLLLNNPNSLSIKVAVDAARQLGIAVVGLQHGEYGFRDSSTMQYQDYAFCDELLVAGDGVSAYSARRYPGALRTTIVGSPDMDGWRSRQMSREELCTAFGFDAARPVVVLCFSNLEGNTRALRNAVASDCTTVRKLRRIVDVCLLHTELQFLIKAHPGEAGPVTPFYAYLERVGATHVRINSTAQFRGMVSAADLYVVNCPSTTLTALALYDRPIYVFEDWFRWEPAALEAVSARCLLSDDIDGFCARLDADLSSGAAFRVSRPGTLLRDHYADPFRDGKSAHRVRTAIIAAAARARSDRATGGTVSTSP